MLLFLRGVFIFFLLLDCRSNLLDCYFQEIVVSFSLIYNSIFHALKVCSLAPQAKLSSDFSLCVHQSVNI